MEQAQGWTGVCWPFHVIDRIGIDWSRHVDRMGGFSSIYHPILVTVPPIRVRRVLHLAVHLYSSTTPVLLYFLCVCGYKSLTGAGVVNT